MPCTTDCGCTTTSIRSNGSANRKCASITSRPLFISVDESIVILAPIVQVGCARRVGRVDVRSSSRRRPAERAAASGHDDASTASGARPGRRHCKIAECSESTGRISPPPRRARRARAGRRRRGSPCSRARGRSPASSAARVASRPAAPTMAFRTTSGAVSATRRAAASGPARTCTPRASRTGVGARRVGDRGGLERVAGSDGRQRLDGAPGCDADDGEVVVRGADLERLGSDRAGGAEDHDALHALRMLPAPRSATAQSGRVLRRTSPSTKGASRCT